MKLKQILRYKCSKKVVRITKQHFVSLSMLWYMYVNVYMLKILLKIKISFSNKSLKILDKLYLNNIG